MMPGMARIISLLVCSSFYRKNAKIWTLEKFAGIILKFEKCGFTIQSSKRCTYEPPHDKTSKKNFAPSEDSDQPGHPPSLIRVLAGHMKKAWVLSYPLSAQRRL